LRKRLRKKLARRSRPDWVSSGVYVTFSQSVFVTFPGPEHPGKKGSAKARYRYRRWVRRKGFLSFVGAGAYGPAEEARLISTREKFYEMFGPPGAVTTA
jgi:hypothetical protein